MKHDLSNIQPLARAIAERTFHKCDATSPPNPPPTQAEVSAWVDAHWQCAAAELEAGLLDDDGKPVAGGNWERGLAAYRERISARKR